MVCALRRNALSCAVHCAQARDIHDNLGKAVDAILTRLKELGAQIDERQVWDGVVRDSVPPAMLPCQRIAGPACGDHTLQVSTHIAGRGCALIVWRTWRLCVCAHRVAHVAAVGVHPSCGAHGGRGYALVAWRTWRPCVCTGRVAHMAAVAHCGRGCAGRR